MLDPSIYTMNHQDLNVCYFMTNIGLRRVMINGSTSHRGLNLLPQERSVSKHIFLYKNIPQKLKFGKQITS